MTTPGEDAPHGVGCACETCPGHDGLDPAAVAEDVFAAVDANYDTEAAR
jgi:hypothetical protein